MRVQEARLLILSFSFVAGVMYITDGFSILGIKFSQIFSHSIREYNDQLQIILLLAIFLGLSFGRVFCSWLCPVATVMNFTSAFTRKRITDGLWTKYISLGIFAALLYAGFSGYLSVSMPALKNLFLAILIFSFATSLVSPRLFCTHLCPVGAFFSVLGIFSIFKLRVGDECRQCRKCNEVCEMNLDVAGQRGLNECSLCWRCVEACPYKTIKLRCII